MNWAKITLFGIVIGNTLLACGGDVFIGHKIGPHPDLPSFSVDCSVHFQKGKVLILKTLSMDGLQSLQKQELVIDKAPVITAQEFSAMMASELQKQPPGKSTVPAPTSPIPDKTAEPVPYSITLYKGYAGLTTDLLRSDGEVLAMKQDARSQEIISFTLSACGETKFYSKH